MKKLLLAGVSLAAIGLVNGAHAADAYLPTKAANGCANGGDPYKNYSCLDAYLGTDFMSRFINYYRLEWGHDAAPSDPKAPPIKFQVNLHWSGTAARCNMAAVASTAC